MKFIYVSDFKTKAIGISVFLGRNFTTWWKNRFFEKYKKNGTKLPHYVREILGLPHLDVKVMEVAKTKQDDKKHLLFCLTFHQIWLINVVDGY